MNWLLSVARVVGVSSPFTAWLVQIGAERNTKQLNNRLKKLEDPISILHTDVPAVSERIYSKVRDAESNSIDLEKRDYDQFSRALAALESRSYITGKHAIGTKFAAGLRLTDPVYILYMCSLYEDGTKMDSLFTIVDRCSPGQSLRAQDVMDETGLPNAVVLAVFRIYESKGFGLCSREIGFNQAYTGRA